VVDREAFSSGTVPNGEQDDASAESTPAASRSAFIEAARKAAQRQQQGAPASGQGSLIARALARFQGNARPGSGAEKPDTAKAAKPAKPAKPPKPARSGKGKTAELRIEPPAVAEPGEPRVEPRRIVAAADEKPESFLSRHRQPILLAASVVALAFLTLNLINQRIAEQQAEAAAIVAPAGGAGASPVSSIEAQASAPAETPAPAVVPPRVITMTDALQTGSIDPAAARAFVPATAMQAMPQAFKAVVADAPAPDALTSPVKVEMPPESVGPLDLRQAAADGDARAQFEIGAIYTEGRAVPQDLGLAATWYERAAAQGFAPAQYRLGNLYENGKGVKKDLEQARLWYQRAAEAGNRMSMHNLAALYAGGDLGKQEFASAAEWFERAATQGLTDSQFNLGMLYARGLGVPQSMDTSYKWFAIAALSGDKDAAGARDDVAKSLDAETVTRLNDEVAAWRPAPIDLAANFAPIGTWSKDFDPGETITTHDVVVGVQTLLNRLGYDIGTPDGVAGPKTAEAIRAFEKATGMSESGAINPRLLAVLSSQPV
jgi:localization factor PodJL